MKKFFLLSILFLFVFVVPAICGVFFIATKVLNGDYSQFSKEKILEILSKETILFYSDGTSQLGSLFGQEHRIYVPIDKIPQVMKDAIVTAEDEDFYYNIGIDIKGIIRAAIHNILFHTRQGASTITQQTVKNLYGRKETDLATKFYEMINAFKLERIYSKDQILEFYLNQFHVTGNGRGVGVASKYYFNKEIEDLNLVESAFIAASVKGPEKYNIFTKTTLASQDKARRDGMARKNYVLERMLKNRKITKQQFDEAVKSPIPFNQGRFQYNEISVNQTIQKQLARQEVLRAIGANNVDEIGTMGLHITTTLDKNIQNAAQYGLRQNLSTMHMILKGFQPEPNSNFTNIQKPELHNFYSGRIEFIDSTLNTEKIKISFGLTSCIADSESINRIAIKTDQIMKRGILKSKAIFLKSIFPGEIVLTSIKGVTNDGTLLCDLETRPKLQGASIVIDKGKIIAMAGGFSSNEYNRALFAQRQPGSTFKIPTYYAALQMGWSVIDAVPNTRDVFLWQGNAYFPRPDHLPNSLETTLLGAGAKSENLASIWLLEHMLDKLNYNQFLDLLKFLNIMNDEMTKSDVLTFIGNKFNASADSVPHITEGVLNKLKSDYLSDLNIINNSKLKLFIKTLHYGTDNERQQKNILNDQELSDKEQKIRINILKNNLLRWTALAKKTQRAVESLSHVIQTNQPITESDQELFSQFAINKEIPNSLSYMDVEGWKPEISSHLVKASEINPANLDELITIAKANLDALLPENIYLDGVVPLSMILSINENLAHTLKDVQEKEPLERLFWNADFRYSLGMYYTAMMVKATGVNAALEWVPSLPLGSNVVTLADLALMYQTFLNGKIYRYFNTPQLNQLIILKRIEDSNGNLLWEAKGKEIEFADPFFSNQILNIMRGTVTAGTAYLKLNNNIILRSNDNALDQKLLVDKIKVPSFGKTGTTNNFTNGTYIGYLPYPTNKTDGLSPNNAFTIATYIGYDSNEPMVNKWYNVHGGEAIPAWQEIALNIIKTQNYADKLGWQELEANKSHLIPFRYGKDLSQVVLPINSGISITAQAPEGESDDAGVNIYADDYSETGKHTFTTYLDGSISDNIFVPKRKISFFSK